MINDVLDVALVVIYGLVIINILRFVLRRRRYKKKLENIKQTLERRRGP